MTPTRCRPSARSLSAVLCIAALLAGPVTDARSAAPAGKPGTAPDPVSKPAPAAKADAPAPPAPLPKLESTLPPDKRPNVVIILGDDQAWSDYGFMGHTVIKTPNLDKLAAEGAVFPNGYVPTSLCRASLATILTGLYAHQHNICCNDPPKGVDRDKMLPFLRDCPTIPRVLGQAGWTSLQTGKFWEGHFSNGGFTHGMTLGGRHGAEGLTIGRNTLKPIDDFLDTNGAKPFFLWYAPMMPHTPHNPPAAILKKYETPARLPAVAKYMAMCEWYDKTVGEVMDRLRARGILDNTIIIVCHDNGWIQSDGPVRTGDQFLTRSKNTPYDAGVRTPIVIRWPGRVKPGRYEDLATTLDILPTILEACGVAAPRDLPGLSLLPRITGGPALSRDAVFGEIFTHDCVELGKPQLSVTHRWVRKGEWKLIVPVRKGNPELYRLDVDPMEKRDLAATQADKVKELTAAMDAWWAVAPK